MSALRVIIFGTKSYNHTYFHFLKPKSPLKCILNKWCLYQQLLRHLHFISTTSIDFKTVTLFTLFILYPAL